ncbi:hypothetical protein Sfum_3345 [Syntrophobacter fumaroxidans MPOB]|uniref:Methyltransferase type 11 n=1 Tax=Syntrophobacter fumaroxidans (strain DSM 10017 / MPOB) TaxID=335543 RepID=A0LNL6_SYNFM|nr:hypothetical protein Sfum_3345 [Syntrophobacter fumaroxidans MPOB]
MASFKYLGIRHKCPFCGGHFSTLLPCGLSVPVLKAKQVIGGGYRLNSICPRCHSWDRERFVYLFLKTYKEYIYNKPINVLHVAPELNLSRKLRSLPYIRYTTADLYSSSVDMQMDITDIKQKNESYDLIICNHVLEHVPNDRKAMSELYRILKKNGLAILQVPISYSMERTIEDSSIESPLERLIAFGQDDHVRIYGLDYILRLRQVGFHVEVNRCSHLFSLEDIKKYGLIMDESIFCCSK